MHLFLTPWGDEKGLAMELAGLFCVVNVIKPLHSSPFRKKEESETYKRSRLDPLTETHKL
ncbi:hypothetical protein DMO16_01430 [Fictibacillus sp. S7]|nr:hypothetical protein DMO16_01430 [Fictibacillus sp. S7]